MKSKWSHLKSEAIRLRKSGKSLPYVHKTLGIPNSTLSYWFKDIELTKKQKECLHKNWQNALVVARKAAVKWHNEQKDSRLEEARLTAQDTLEQIDCTNDAVLELALSILYLGEGSKKKEETALSSSDPGILRFYVSSLVRLYDVDKSTLRCQLHLRADQDEKAMKQYWSKELDLPMSCFRYVHVDPRTAGRKTYDHYKGVCSVAGPTIAIQRKLMYLARDFLVKINQQETSG